MLESMGSADPAVDLNGILRRVEGQAAGVNNVTHMVLDFKIETRYHYKEIQENTHMSMVRNW